MICAYFVKRFYSFLNKLIMLHFSEAALVKLPCLQLCFFHLFTTQTVINAHKSYFQNILDDNRKTTHHRTLIDLKMKEIDLV